MVGATKYLHLLPMVAVKIDAKFGVPIHTLSPFYVSKESKVNHPMPAKFEMEKLLH